MKTSGFHCSYVHQVLSYCRLKWKQFINIHLQSSNSTWRFQLSYLSFVVWHFKIFFQVELRGNIGLKYNSSIYNCIILYSTILTFYLINQRNWEVECFCTEGPSTAIQSQGCNLDIFVFRSNLSHESVRIKSNVFMKKNNIYIFMCKPKVGERREQVLLNLLMSPAEEYS